MKLKTLHAHCLAILSGMLGLPLQGQALTIADTPLFIAGNVQPLVMLDMSKDHQLYYKAYNDFSDLDGNLVAGDPGYPGYAPSPALPGVPETTYVDRINYYGYFDNKKCYVYSTTNNRFAPPATGFMATGANSHYCSGQWSGNFLNWATMTRMDAVRKLLYGGMRSTDTSSLTVLERAFLPTEAHSFTKYYNNTDIASLTPFSGIATTPPSATSTTSNSVGSGTKTFSTTLSVKNGDQVLAFVTGSQATQWMIGGVSSTATGSLTLTVPAGSLLGTATSTSWTLQNLSATGITFCSLTPGATSGVNQFSQTNTNPPIIRVASGNFALWNANEVWQCYWSEEGKTNTAGFLRNGNQAYFSGINASASDPSQVTHGLGSGTAQAGASSYSATAQGQYVVRVEACNVANIGQERCKQYGSSYKPIGLLQQYGDNDQLLFGLMTGSYTKNISGGVLRSNIKGFSGEVNAADGTFNATAYGIVYNLNKLRMYGYNYGTGIYNTASSSGGDDCTYQQIGFVFSGGSVAQGSPANQGNCSTWGNPMAEIYLESLRYLASKAPTPPATATTPAANSAFTYAPGTGSSATKDDNLGLKVATWSSPINSANYCAPINVLNFNASVSSRDSDQMGGLSDLGAGSSANVLTSTVGTKEGIDTGSWFIGNNGAASPDLLCSAKSGTLGLGSFAGLCPEAPTQQGTYLMSGAAYYARTNRIRSDLTVPAGKTYAYTLKPNTYGIALASNVPKIQVTVGTGASAGTVTILPAYRLDISSTGAGPFGGGTLVDFKVISQTSTSGKFYVNWEDSEQGGDYDQDMWGIISYSVSGSNITVTTQAVSASTANGQGFGYVISGTNKDGPHFHSGILNFDYTDPTNITVTSSGNTHLNASGGCSNCVVTDPASSATYAVGSSTASLPKDPLWYAAKWGGFNDINNNNLPDAGSEWDNVINDSGLTGADGLPDNFFFVTSPLSLEKALNNAFLQILLDSSSSAVAANSTSFTGNNRVYQGRFGTATWSGQLLSYQLDSNGTIPQPPQPEWDTGLKINNQVGTSTDTRLILTRNTATGAGVDFQYANLSSGSPSQQEALDKDYLLTLDKCGPERVAYLRGQTGNEGTGNITCATAPNNSIQKFRSRDVSKLGDVINSSPIYVGAPLAGYSDAAHPGYVAFRNNFKSRTPVVYLGANDGMLHGIDVSVITYTQKPTPTGGTEILGYVPTPLYGNLSRLTSSTYKNAHKYYVDGTPMVADACISPSSTSLANNLCSNASTAVWKTVLVGGLGAGGRGFYALNVTNPGDATKDTPNTPKFNVANAANIPLWEFTATDDADLGYTYNASPARMNNGQARQIVKFENGRWGVVVGNGYNSPGGKAVLYVLFLSGPSGGTPAKTWVAGTDYVKIVADAQVSGTNGLSTPMPYDSDGNGLVDTAYAGDLKGNLWKFDLGINPTAPTSANPHPANPHADPSNWKMAFGACTSSPAVTCTPLFAAGSAQPITMPPEVSLYPGGGVMVLFGTGKYLEIPDSSATVQQSFYGILDKPTTAPVSGRSALAGQSISLITVSGNSFRTVSKACGGVSQAACPSPFKGWYLDFPTNLVNGVAGPAERATGPSKLVLGTLVFNTLIPSDTPCDFGGTGWLMALDYASGALRPFNVFDTNGSGTIDKYDTAAAGTQVGAAIGGSAIVQKVTSSGGNGGTAVSSLTTGDTSTTQLNFGGSGGGDNPSGGGSNPLCQSCPQQSPKGRVMWREIVL